MTRALNELIFDLLLVAAAGIAFTTYMLGILLDPIPGIVAGIVLLGVGLLAIVPREKLIVTGISGLFALLLAGVVVPRFVSHASTGADELSLSLALGGVVMLLTVGLLHITTFRPLKDQPV